ncbi:DoxX family protein [Albibacterium indicum]|uniref:DoxX family protein n=1 Tax=Albibacterium indicum TaxID=2292082 RepID=UPI000E4D8F0F|nr:DoxX family protein [Pedobacter indicus]
MAALSSLGRYKDFGLLLARIGLGLSFIFLHGYPKLVGGVETWKVVGSAMSNLGIDFFPAVWGFLAGFTEAVGGLFLLLGLFYRPACLLLAFTMLVAGMNHLAMGDGLMGAAHAFELLVVFVGLLFVGPGKYSVDKR